MIKKVVLGLIILVSLVVAYNLVTQIMDAVKSSERLSQAAETVYELEARNKALKQELSRIQSPQFVEEQTRNKLGLGKIGETVVIIPENTLNLVLSASSSAQTVRLPNWLGWWKVFWR